MCVDFRHYSVKMQDFSIQQLAIIYGGRKLL